MYQRMADNEIEEVKVRNILRLINYDIDQLNRNRNNNNNIEYKKKRKIIIEDLDRVEKHIMQENWVITTITHVNIFGH